VAEDFAGHAWTELYTEELRRRHPLTTIATRGTRDPGETARSSAEKELLEELGALGYLD
jgi:8-oxo-dGTP pyrophosphatase MutT (NUDIX family)